MNFKEGPAMKEMTPEARAQRNAYQRKWYREHKEQAQQYQRDHWERLAKRAAQEKEVAQDDVTE